MLERRREKEPVDRSRCCRAAKERAGEDQDAQDGTRGEQWAAEKAKSLAENDVKDLEDGPGEVKLLKELLGPDVPGALLRAKTDSQVELDAEVKRVQQEAGSTAGLAMENGGTGCGAFGMSGPGEKERDNWLVVCHFE
eukprot:Skav203321  [mRNA]  locus=scaffold284:80686:83770:- [translate_table: standard]